MHLALAAGTPALALFGPTAPAILVRDEPRLHAIASGDPCQGCWNASEDETQPGVCPLHRSACLDSITVEAVRDRAYALLAERK
jgi:ADP-heptose:LPS heptosyltransferase